MDRRNNFFKFISNLGVLNYQFYMFNHVYTSETVEFEGTLSKFSSFKLVILHV